ncbi:TraB/GumN family protein [Paenibacillus sp. JCM 10914]|uniref:TraB/GumN family protein n=1 Tax=Paenibacillus sp. JCM 10914 TaxID=1236974 RepID=UPI0003CC50D5|nr:TraB/GumN family protein [Paenibacillus sp. JCM 10914]GAE05311.1 hypothetical protein JCM10914_1407 [Paenibacillus sp. JCM 10914]
MQERKRWSRLKRFIGTGALSTAILIGNVLPLHAAEANVAVPDISPWSIATLNEGEKYGIYPMDWYYDGTFKQTITSEKFSSLINATEKKLDGLGFTKKYDSLTMPASEEITRSIVVDTLYQLLDRYELPESFAITGVSPASYLQQKGIIKGSGGNTGLQLDHPASVEQAVVMASRLVEYTYDTADAGAEGLMWKVTNDNNTLYLLGSVHMGIAEMYPMHKSIREAFSAADDLWVELDIVNGDMTYLQEKMVYSDGTQLQDHIAPATYEKLQTVLKQLGLPLDTFNSFKPFAISTTLTSFAYFEDPADSIFAMAAGIDQYFITNALLTGKPIHELEGVKVQADVLGDVSAEAQEQELVDLLDTLSSKEASAKIATNLKQMQLEWVAGNADGLKDQLMADGQLTQGETNQKLLGERDKNMALKLAELLEQDGKHTSFVVVGAAITLWMAWSLTCSKKKVTTYNEC